MVDEKRLRIGEQRLYRILQTFFRLASLFGMCSASIRNGRLQVHAVTRSKIVLAFYCICLAWATIGNLQNVLRSTESSDLIFWLGYMFQSFSAYISLYTLFFRLETFLSILKKLSAVFALIEPRYEKCQLKIKFYVFAGLLVPVVIKSLELLFSYWINLEISSFYMMVSISGIIFRKVPLAYNVAFFCSLCVCIKDALSNINTELLTGITSEVKYAELMFCHEQLHEVVELVNNLFGLQFLVILIGCNAFLHNDVMYYFRIVFDNIYKGNQEKLDLFFFSWLIFDTCRIAFIFWAACSLVHEVYFNFYVKWQN